MKYPTNFFLFDLGDKQTPSNICGSYEPGRVCISDVNAVPLQKITNFFILDVIDNPQNLTIDAYLQKVNGTNGAELSALLIKNEKVISISGVQGVETSSPGNSLLVYIPYKNKIFSIGVSGEGSATQAGQAFDNLAPQILSTFKFTVQTQADSTVGWTSYINKTYGFQFDYPAKGISQLENADKTSGGLGVEECGKHIVETDSSLGHEISFDNFFGVGIVTTQQSIKDYIGSDSYQVLNLTPISGSNADEAFSVGGLKDGVDSSKLNFQPFGSVLIYKKGNNIVTFNRNNGVLAGCFPPALGGDSNYMSVFPEYTKLKWNVQDSFKFTQ